MKQSLFNNEGAAVMGGTGFIGAPLVNQLRNAGAKVRTISNLKNSHKIEKELKGCKYVFHLAATFSPSGAGQKDENFLMTKSVLDASVKSGAEKVFIASSAAVYPASPSIMPIPESLGRENRPNGVYGQSKRICEDLAQKYAKEYGLGVVIARIFNAYGPGDKSERIIPTMIKKIFSNREMRVNNSADQTRDFIYIDDCVAGIIACMEGGKAGQIFNICAGREIGLMEAASIIAGQLKRKPKLRVKTGGGQIVKSVGDTALARKYIGFEAKVSFEEGINRTIEWFLQNEINK